MEEAEIKILTEFERTIADGEDMDNCMLEAFLYISNKQCEID